MTFEAMIDDMMGARVVYLGEEHNSEEDHALHARILEALYAHDSSLALGLEMFQRPAQPHLDDYVAGRIDEDTMLERTQWRERWGSDFDAYRPMVTFARQHRLPVVALNARREITRVVGRQGIDGLEEAVRASLPELDLDNQAHRRLVSEGLGSHAESMRPEQLERLYQAQVIWDETMAETIAQTLSSPDAPPGDGQTGDGSAVARMVVIAGRLHVESGLGIPERAARRGASPHRILIGLDHAESRREGRADFLWLR
jgi:uncharacterized iron-regulated protein